MFFLKPLSSIVEKFLYTRIHKYGFSVSALMPSCNTYRLTWVSLTLDKGYLLSIDGWGCVPYLLFYLRPNYGGGNEDNGDLLQKVPCTHCYTQCLQPCSRPPLTHASAGDSWTLMGKSGSVSCGVTAPFSWVLVHTRLCLCPPRVCETSGSSMVGLMATSSKRAYAIPRPTAPRAPAPSAVHC